jgi:phenylalanyl-tRNA synthetase beta chain
MKFKTKDLEKYISGKIDWQKVAEDLTLKSFESSYENGILDVDILPNRYPDASSLIGLAKEISVLNDRKLKLPKISLRESSKLAKNYFKVKNQSKFTPYYFGRIILDVGNKKSPPWLEEFVKFYGFNSINFLVDLANFVMIENGAPLHIFDLDKIKGEIIVREAKKGEKFISLENKEYILEGGEIVIADREKILALAGIKGGKVAEVNLETKNIFIEAAVFDPVKIYTTSRKLNLKTEASFRFERKVAPHRALLGLERVASLIQRNLGGKVLRGIFNFQKFKEEKIYFDLQKIEKFSGLKLNKREIEKILKSLGFKILNKEIIVPLDRLDIQNEEDVVEEVLRIYGLNKIPSLYEIPFREIFIEPILEFNEYLRDILIKAGYNEAHNYNFYGEKEKNIFKEILPQRPVEVLNPVSENYLYFQGSLIPNLLKSVYLNQFHFKEIRLFEISKIAHQEKKIIENYNLGIAFAFHNKEEILRELKGVLSLFSKELNFDLEINELKENKVLNFGGEIYIDNNKVGLIGLIAKEILDEFLIDLNVGVLELNIQKLKEHFSFIKEFKPLPVFALITRDISFFVDEKVKFKDLKEEIKKLKINFLQDIKLIDVYFSPKKSLTIRLLFSHPQKNLQEDEVEKEISRIIHYLKNKHKIELR